MITDRRLRQRSKQSESIESIPANLNHSELDGECGDLPTPLGGSPDQQPYRHPSSEGILDPSGWREIIGYE
jgi:hypothetical protein